jgi:S-adenosylmethionine uptake transporter
VFYRGVVGIVFMAIYAKANGTVPTTRYPRHACAWRSIVGVMSFFRGFMRLVSCC